VIAVGRSVAKGTDGRLRIACAESMTAGLLAPVLRSWHRRSPGIQLTLTELTSADALGELVETGQADLAVGPEPTRWNGGLSVIGREEVVAAMSPDHPLATADNLTLDRLVEHPFIGYHPDNGIDAWLKGVFAERRLAPHPILRTRQTVAAAQLAAAGLGVALVPTTALPATYPGAIRRLHPQLARDVVVLTAAHLDSSSRGARLDSSSRGAHLDSSSRGAHLDSSSRRGGPSDPIVRRFAADVVRRGLPVAKPITDRLAQ
jgi:DNA-binding transcriptional LysR family regulator